MQINKTILLLSLIILSGCNGTNQPGLKGILYYGSQGIDAIDLATNRVSEVYAAPGFSINKVENMGDKHLLISMYGLNPSADREKIGIIDGRKLTLDVLRPGSGAIYMASHNKIVYYNNQSRLSVFDPVKINQAEIIIDSDPPDAPGTVIQVSDDVVLFESMRNSASYIWTYNILTGTYLNLAGLKNCSLNHSFWRARSEQLFCNQKTNNNEITGKFYLVSLDGSHRKNISLGEGEFWPVTYIQELDAMVLQERSFVASKHVERHPVWLYSFDTESRQRIAEDVLLGTGATYSTEDIIAR